MLQWNSRACRSSEARCRREKSRAQRRKAVLLFYFGSSWPEDLVRTENGFGKAARLEQGEAQQDSIADTRPDGVHHIAANGDALHQNRIDRKSVV